MQGKTLSIYKGVAALEKKNDVKDLKEEKDVKDEKKEHNSADGKQLL